MHQALTKKVLSGGVVVLALTALAAGVTSTSLSATHNAAHQLTTATVPYVQHSERFEKHVFRSISEAFIYERTRNPEFREEAVEELAEAAENLRLLDTLGAAGAPDNASHAIQARRQAVFDDFATQINALLDSVTAGDSAATATAMARLKRSEDAIEALGEEANTLLNRDLSRSTEATTGTIQLGVASVLGGFGLVALAILVAVWMLQRQIVRPIRALAEAAELVASGNLTPTISRTATAEIGDLQQAFARMVGDLQAQQDAFERRLVAEQARAVAEEANRAKTVFLGAMSHELRTPLTTILGYTELLQRELDGGHAPSIRADLDCIHAASQHLLALINNLLDLSKIEAGQAIVQWDAVNLPELAQEVADSMRPQIKQNSNTLRVQCAPDIASIRTDRTKLKQILLNVLDNAAKFTEHGTITLAVSQEQRDGQAEAIFRISDTGIGIQPGELARIFRPYTQADQSIAHRYGGSGLGLTVTQRLCALLHGTISAESAPEQGSTFTVRLPLTGDTVEARTDAPVPRTTTPGQANAPCRPAPPLVLVVGGAAALPSPIVCALKADGMQVATATSGREGAELASNLRPEVIVLERDLPELDEWHLRRTIGSEPGLQDTPLLVVEALVATPALGERGGTAAPPEAVADTIVRAVQQRLHRSAAQH